MFAAMMLAPAANAAPVTLVCDAMLDAPVTLSDSPTILYLDEAARTVSGHLGAWHRRPPNENPEAEVPLNALPATFSEEEVIFTPPAFAGSFHLNRLTGTLLPLYGKTPMTGGRQCHVQQKQF
jgi:hypothetical protein